MLLFRGGNKELKNYNSQTPFQVKRAPDSTVAGYSSEAVRTVWPQSSGEATLHCCCITPEVVPFVCPHSLLPLDQKVGIMQRLISVEGSRKALK